MDLYWSQQRRYRPAAGPPYPDYALLNGQDEGVNDWFGASHLGPRVLTPSEVEEYHRCQAHRTQEANSRWFQPEQLPVWANGACTAPHQGTIPVVNVGNGHDNVHRQLPGEDHRHSQCKPRPDHLYPAIEHFGLRRYREPRREHLKYESAEEPRRLDGMGISAQQHYNETMAQRALPSLQMPSFQMVSAPSNDLLPQSSWDAEDPRMVEMYRLAREKRDEQKRLQEKAQFPTAKPGNSYTRPSRISGPVRTVHDDDMERREMSNRTFPMQYSSSEPYREAYRRYPADKERKKGEERRKVAVSVPTPEPTRTESVEQLLSSVNKALEQKVEAAELETADTNCSDSEALRAQSQQLQQDQNDANETARQCGESFWYGYSVNHPTGISSMTTQWPQNSDSASAQSPVSKPGLLEGEEDLEDRIRACLRRSQPEHPQEMSDHRSTTEAMDKVPGDLLKCPRTASGQENDSSSLEPRVDSTSQDGKNSAADGPHVPLASHKDLSFSWSENNVCPLPIRQAKETNVGPEVRADDRNVENAKGTGPSGYVDVESEWEEVDGDLEDEGWSDVDEDGEEDNARRESSDMEWASDNGSEGAF